MPAAAAVARRIRTERLHARRNGGGDGVQPPAHTQWARVSRGRPGSPPAVAAHGSISYVAANVRLPPFERGSSRVLTDQASEGDEAAQGNSHDLPHWQRRAVDRRRRRRGLLAQSIGRSLKHKEPAAGVAVVGLGDRILAQHRGVKLQPIENVCRNAGVDTGVGHVTLAVAERVPRHRLLVEPEDILRPQRIGILQQPPRGWRQRPSLHNVGFRVGGGEPRQKLVRVFQWVRQVCVSWKSAARILFGLRPSRRTFNGQLDGDGLERRLICDIRQGVKQVTT